MSIPLPPLEDRTYADLRDEALALIPSLAPEWTNHNPSDPGITLIELFAWLTEMLIYQINRLPEANTCAFLELLNGRKPGSDLQEEIRTTVLDLRRSHRAVTAEDYEMLAREASPGVARVRCVPRRDLAGRTEERRLIPRGGYVSLIAVPNPKQTGALDPASWPGAPLPDSKLLSVVSEHIKPCRLVAVRQAVVPPIYVPIQAEVVVAARPDVPVGPLRTRVIQALEEYLDVLTGGPDGEGWPFGRDVYVSELYRLLEKEVPGVDFVPDLALSSTCPEGAPRCVVGSELWHEQGDPIGIGLSAHHLPWARIDPAAIVIGSAFLPVRVQITVTAEEGFEPAVAWRAMKIAVRRLFHPLHGGPDGGSLREITRGEILNEVESLPEIKDVTGLVLAAGTAPSGKHGAEAVRFESGELADLTVVLEI